MVELEVDALVLVAQEELAAVVEVAVDDVDERLAEVRQAEQQPLLHLLELARLDLPVARPLVETEAVELLVDAELGREELVDESDVVVQRPHLEDLLPPLAEAHVPRLLLDHVLAVVPLLAEPALVPPVLDVAEQLHAELVRVQVPRARRHDGGVVVRVVEDLARVAHALGHEPRA